MLEKLPVYWDRCEFIFFPQPQSLHVCREINCEEAGHGCKCLDVAKSPAVRQATAGEQYQEKSWGYDGLQPLPLLAQVRSHSQEYGIKRQRRQHTRVCIQKWNTNIVPQFCLLVFFSQSWIYQHNESVLRGIKTKRRSGNIKSVSQGQI